MYIMFGANEFLTDSELEMEVKMSAKTRYFSHFSARLLSVLHRSSWAASQVAPEKKRKSHFLSAAWQVASAGKTHILSTTTGTLQNVTFQACRQ